MLEELNISYFASSTAHWKWLFFCYFGAWNDVALQMHMYKCIPMSSLRYVLWHFHCAPTLWRTQFSFKQKQACCTSGGVTLSALHCAPELMTVSGFNFYIAGSVCRHFTNAYASVCSFLLSRRVPPVRHTQVPSSDMKCCVFGRLMVWFCDTLPLRTRTDGLFFFLVSVLCLDMNAKLWNVHLIIIIALLLDYRIHCNIVQWTMPHSFLRSCVECMQARAKDISFTNNDVVIVRTDSRSPGSCHHGEVVVRQYGDAVLPRYTGPVFY